MTGGPAGPALPPLALLAGGLATRLRPVTETIPKSMIPVCGEPFVAHQLRLLRREGIADVVLCVGHLSRAIEDFVGDGSAFGLRVRYSYDGERPLGTGGALRKALPLLGDAFFVTYGDSYLDIPFAAVARAFHAAGRPGLMTVMRNQGRWDASNVRVEDGRVVFYGKNSGRTDLEHIDYGLLVLSAGLFAGRPAGEPFDLGIVQGELAAAGQLAGYEVDRRFYEIGSPAGLAETEAHLAAGAGRSRP